ncbi:LAMI_0A08163g1_1 [Lachancea mirantina]|uniref:LAMI_0A08163g1_1 n=1 Tax=Lachancea mirantina TaxID=1230905 RepID=A0A1G4IRC4_9SACH|nr:LAMI_0A08163g1_1 [Lachancea mirantina]
MPDSEEITECSSPQLYMESDTDKQILEWAGKLELESIELRERSTLLIAAMEKNSRELRGSFSKLSEISEQLKELKDLNVQAEKTTEQQTASLDRVSGLETAVNALREELLDVVSRTAEAESRAREKANNQQQHLWESLKAVCETSELIARNFERSCAAQESLERMMRVENRESLLKGLSESLTKSVSESVSQSVTQSISKAVSKELQGAVEFAVSQALARAPQTLLPPVVYDDRTALRGHVPSTQFHPTYHHYSHPYQATPPSTLMQPTPQIAVAPAAPPAKRAATTRYIIPWDEMAGADLSSEL